MGFIFYFSRSLVSRWFMTNFKVGNFRKNMLFQYNIKKSILIYGLICDFVYTIFHTNQKTLQPGCKTFIRLFGMAFKTHTLQTLKMFLKHLRCKIQSQLCILRNVSLKKMNKLVIYKKFRNSFRILNVFTKIQILVHLHGLGPQEDRMKLLMYISMENDAFLITKLYIYSVQILQTTEYKTGIALYS